MQEGRVTNDTNISVLLSFVQERSRKPANLPFSPFMLRKTAASQISAA